MRNIFASEIAGFLNSTLIGNDFIVKLPASLNNLKNQSLIYLDKDYKNHIDQLSKYNDILIISFNNLTDQPANCSVLISENPKIDFIKVLNEFFIEYDNTLISGTAKIHAGSKIGRNVSVGEYVIIGPEVIIGDNSKILNNVVITGRTEIGKNCIIKDNSTIGSEGYDFDIDDKGIPIHFPHIGKICIGDYVWIGANTSIENATIEDTVISNFVKIDDLVQVGASCKIGYRCMITAGVIISRNVIIKEKCLLAPNVSIGENISIAKNNTIGIGAVVLKDIKEENCVFVGNPAIYLRKK